MQFQTMASERLLYEQILTVVTRELIWLREWYCYSSETVTLSLLLLTRMSCEKQGFNVVKSCYLQNVNTSQHFFSARVFLWSWCRAPSSYSALIGQHRVMWLNTEFWLVSMPGLVLYDRRWGVGSDDCIVPASMLSVTHLVWIIVLIPVIIITFTTTNNLEENITDTEVRWLIVKRWWWKMIHWRRIQIVFVWSIRMWYCLSLVIPSAYNLIYHNLITASLPRTPPALPLSLRDLCPGRGLDHHCLVARKRHQRSTSRQNPTSPLHQASSHVWRTAPCISVSQGKESLKKNEKMGLEH